VALGLGAVFAVAVFIVIAPKSVVVDVAPIADLPVVALPATALPCTRVESRRRELDCIMPRAGFFAMKTDERTARIGVTRQTARAAGFDSIHLIDVGGVWRTLSTEPETTPKPPPLPVVATVPLPPLPEPTPQTTTVTPLPPAKTKKPPAPPPTASAPTAPKG